MTRARKNTANRPSEANREFVTNSRGEKVRNVAYQGKNTTGSDKGAAVNPLGDFGDTTSTPYIEESFRSPDELYDDIVNTFDDFFDDYKMSIDFNGDMYYGLAEFADAYAEGNENNSGSEFTLYMSAPLDNTENPLVSTFNEQYIHDIADNNGIDYDGDTYYMTFSDINALASAKDNDNDPRNIIIRHVDTAFGNEPVDEEEYDKLVDRLVRDAYNSTDFDDMARYYFESSAYDDEEQMEDDISSVADALKNTTPETYKEFTQNIIDEGYMDTGDMFHVSGDTIVANSFIETNTTDYVEYVMGMR